MATQPLRWFGASGLAALERALSDALHAWAHEWCVDAPAVAVACRSAPTEPLEPTLERFAIHEPGRAGAVHLIAAPDDPSLVVLGTARLAREPHAELVGHVRECAIAALLDSIGAALQWRAVERVDAPVTDRRDADLVADLRFGSHRLTLYLEAAVAARLPRRAVTAMSRALVPRTEAVLRGTGRARLQLDLGEYPVAELERLAPGVVLSSRVPLTHSFELKLGDRLALRARLGRSGKHKAIVLESP